MTDTTAYPRRWWALSVLCLSLLLISMDNTILNVALPTLVRELDASASQLQWIVDAYVLVFAGLLLTMGSLGDRYGRKLALNVGFLVFGVGALLAAWSGSAGALIATRALMGVGGALIMPATLSILTNIFPSEERGKAIAIWAGTAGLGVPLGPVIGGWLLEHFWWGSVFLVNVPVLVVALVSGWYLLPESRDPEAAPLDPLGALLSIVGLATLLYAIIEAPDNGWSSGTTLVGFALAGILLTGFALWEWRTARPMLDTRLFRDRRFSGASIAIALVFFALFGSMFFLTQYQQFVWGHSALGAGLRIVPVALGIAAGSGISTRLVPRLGVNRTVALGLAIVATGLGILSSLAVDSSYWHLATGIVVIGFGMGTAMAPATNAIMSAVPRANAGVGSAMNDTTRQVGGALGVAILGSLLSTSYGSHMNKAVAGLPPEAAGPARDQLGAAAEIALRIGGPQGQALLTNARSAFVDAMGSTLLVAAAVALAGAVIALVFLPTSDTAEAGPGAESIDKSRDLERAA